MTSSKLETCLLKQSLKTQEKLKGLEIIHQNVMLAELRRYVTIHIFFRSSLVNV